MIRITIAQTSTKLIEGVSTKSGTPKPYKFRLQTAYAHTVDKDGNKPPYPERFELTLDNDAAPYPAGDYTLQPSAFYVDKNGRLVCAPRLTPVTAKKPGPEASAV